MTGGEFVGVRTSSTKVVRPASRCSLKRRPVDTADAESARRHRRSGADVVVGAQLPRRANP